MLSIFIDPTETVRVNFVVASKKVDAKSLVADLTEQDLIETYGDEIDPASIEKHWVDFRKPNFEDHGAIMSGAIHFDDKGVVGDPSSIQYGRFCRLAKAWSLSDEVTVEQIKKLNPLVAMVIDSGLQSLL